MSLPLFSFSKGLAGSIEIIINQSVISFIIKTARANEVLNSKMKDKVERNKTRTLAEAGKLTHKTPCDLSLGCF